MKRGIVKSLNIGHKNNKKILYTGDKVTENDVNNFDQLVKEGHIELSKETKAEAKAKAEAEAKAKAKAEAEAKAEAKKSK